MPILRRFIGWISLIITAVLLGFPTASDAQRYGTMMRRPRHMTSVRVWAVPRPWFHPHFYPNPYINGTWRTFPRRPTYYGSRGSVRLEVKPVETEVYVDGYYAGVVDSYDGFFQRLYLTPGKHKLELRLQGYRSIKQALYLPAGSTFHIKNLMKPVGDGIKTRRPTQTFAEPHREAPPSSTRLHRGGVPTPDANSRGTVAIRVQPADATVRIDDEEWQSPDGSRLDLELSVGRHRIDVDRAGYESHTTVIQIRPEEKTLVNISLPRK
ncbi:MAG: PEGA domain-containing protein [Acidobacteriota bacterium]|nr:PEGA domain-containing protein [Acidobacteriota bacterium]